MDPSNRRSMVAVQEASEARDPVTNESQKTWSDIKCFWADLNPIRSNDIIGRAGIEGFAIWEMRANYYDAKDVRSYHRVTFEGRVFHILGPGLRDEREHGDILFRLRETDERP